MGWDVGRGCCGDVDGDAVCRVDVGEDVGLQDVCELVEAPDVRDVERGERVEGGGDGRGDLVEVVVDEGPAGGEGLVGEGGVVQRDAEGRRRGEGGVVEVGGVEGEDGAVRGEGAQTDGDYRVGVVDVGRREERRRAVGRRRWVED